MSRLVNPAGRPLVVARHHRDWSELFTTSSRLALLAPRDHGKSTIALAYILWRFWRHGRDPATGRLRAASTGTFSAVIFGATRAQTAVHVAIFRDLLLANRWLFEELLPRPGGSGRARTAWSGTHIRLTNGAELRARTYRTSTRGLHPDLLVLDDVLSDENSRSRHQRDLSWQYFVGTLLPMHPAQLVVIGTAFHREDLLFSLGPGGTGAGLGFSWRAYAALDPDGEKTLWPERHSYAELAALREAEPIVFSREYQNDPRDDAASMFPTELTQRALDRGADLTFVPYYHRGSDEIVVLGFDPAVSERATADYSVAIVAAVNLRTRVRRVLTIRRYRRRDLSEQLALIRSLCANYDVTLCIVEANGTQTWLVEELKRYPETAGRIFPHTTGVGRNDLVTGIPGLKLMLLADLWIMPSGDRESRALALAWQDEMSAFGWRDGKLEGIGEHDDLVLATWFVEQGIRLMEQPRNVEVEEIIYGEDIGIERVRISPDLDEFELPADHDWQGGRY